MRAVVAAQLAEILCAQRRDDEAEHFIDVGRQNGGRDNILAQGLRATTAAKVLARRNAVEDAERVAREAIAIFANSDMLDCRADANLSLYEVFRTAGRQQDAVSAIEEALRLYTQKGNVASATRARTLLAACRGPTATDRIADGIYT
jgi:hypothetical protein